MTDDTRLTPDEWQKLKGIIELHAWKRGGRVAQYLGLELTDFQQAGWTAVLQTLDGYDRNRNGVSAYFSQRIAGAMVDLIRSTGDLVRVPRGADLDKRTTVRVSQCLPTRVAVRSITIRPEHDLERADEMAVVFKAMRFLLNDMAAEVWRLKLSGLSATQIGNELGISNSYVFKLATESIDVLKTYFRGRYERDENRAGRGAEGGTTDDRRADRPAGSGRPADGVQVDRRGEAAGVSNPRRQRAAQLSG